MKLPVQLNTRADYMGVIFQYLSQWENVNAIQHLNKWMYYVKVPMFVQVVIVRISVPKFPAKLQFINMVRNMNPEVRKFKTINYEIDSLTGHLSGEFEKYLDNPNGRCCF